MLNYLSYLFKYVILYVVFELYLLIKYIIIFNFLNKINGQMQFKKSTVTIQKNRESMWRYHKYLLGPGTH
jgi:hypothetical protein